MTMLSARDLASHGPPTMDRRGIRFELDGHVYRAYRQDVAPFYRSLLTSRLADELFEAGLVRTWVSSVQVEGFDLVTESERVPVVTYPIEWPTSMLRASGLLIAKLAMKLASHGLGLHDSHPWNVLFDGPRPVWVDVSSVTETASLSPEWEREFRSHIVVPLALHAHGRHSIADAVATEHRIVRAKGLFAHRLVRAIYPPRYARLRRGPREPMRFLDRVVGYLEALPDAPTGTEWSNYVQSPDATVGSQETYNDKQRSVDTVLASLPPGRVLDVGANAGWFSELAVSRGHEVIAIDPDDFTASGLFRRARDERLPILPLRMDIMWPTGSHGLGLAHDAAPARLKCDTSMWLAVVHHLARYGYTFDTISKVISMFTGRDAIVEFVPRDDVHLRGWWIADQPWYTQSDFIRAMTPFFPQVQVLDSTPAPRTMLHFRRA